MDFGFLGIGTVHTFSELMLAIFSIVIIDLVLAGDNAVVIALAVKKLPSKEKLIGIIVGAGAAVALRIILTFFAAQLMQVSLVKLIGGVLILWIAVKLLRQGAEEDQHKGGKEAYTIWQAVWLIMIADITMSTDNVLAVAGASKGSLALLIFGLGLSIPLVVFTSNLLSKLMDRFPIIMYIGAAVLGKVGGEMIMTDPYVLKFVETPKWAQYLVEIFLAVAVVALGWYLAKRKNKEAQENNRGTNCESNNKNCCDHVSP